MELPVIQKLREEYPTLFKDLTFGQAATGAEVPEDYYLRHREKPSLIGALAKGPFTAGKEVAKLPGISDLIQFAESPAVQEAMMVGQFAAPMGGFVRIPHPAEVKYTPEAIKGMEEMMEKIASRFPATSKASETSRLAFGKVPKKLGETAEQKFIAGYYPPGASSSLGTEGGDILVWWKNPHEIAKLQREGYFPSDIPLEDLMRAIGRHEDWAHLTSAKIPVIEETFEKAYPSIPQTLKDLIIRATPKGKPPAGEFGGGLMEIFNPLSFKPGRGVSYAGKEVERWARENPESFKKLMMKYWETAQSTELALPPSLAKFWDPASAFLEELRSMAPIRTGKRGHVGAKPVPIRGRMEAAEPVVSKSPVVLEEERIRDAIKSARAYMSDQQFRAWIKRFYPRYQGKTK